MINHDEVPVPVPVPAPAPAPVPVDGVVAAAAIRVGFFDFLTNRRNRTIFCYTGWGFAGIISTTTAPRFAVNSDHIMLYFVFLIAGVVLYLMSMAAADLPWMEPWAARLEGVLAKMIPRLLG